MATSNMTIANFEKAIADNDIVLIDFWANWCGPCKMFGPTYEKISEKHPDIHFAKVDTEAEQQLAAMFGIQSIPTLAIFRDGVLLFREAGALPEAALEDLIGQVRKLDMDKVRADMEKQQQEHKDHECVNCGHHQ